MMRKHRSFKRPPHVPRWTEVAPITVTPRQIDIRRSLLSRRPTCRRVDIDERFLRDCLPAFEPSQVGLWFPSCKSVRESSYPWVMHKLMQAGFKFAHPLAVLEFLRSHREVLQEMG